MSLEKKQEGAQNTFLPQGHFSFVTVLVQPSGYRHTVDSTRDLVWELPPKQLIPVQKNYIGHKTNSELLRNSTSRKLHQITERINQERFV